MSELLNENYVKALKQNITDVFTTPQGKEVMDFLERSCGWYESIFDPQDRDRILINAGRREVIATIKTFLEQSPERIVTLAEQKENSNG